MNPEKLLQMKDKIQKLMNLADSEAKLGNIDAAANIAEKVQSLMQQFKLEESDFLTAHPEIEYIPLIGISTIENIFLSKRPKEIRKPWAEFLASTIALGYYCKVTVNYRTGELSFYGVDFDRDIAIMMFEKLTSMALESCKNEMEKAKRMIGKKGMDFKTQKPIIYPKVWMGDDVFTDNFMFGFGSKLEENYAKSLANDNTDLFERINKLIASLQDRNQVPIEFGWIAVNETVQDIGRKYGNFTAKQKAVDIQKSANIEISKTIKRVEDDRIGEVILVIDDSASMAGTKIEQAKGGVKDFAEDAISKRFAVGLISFGERATKLSEQKLELNGEFSKAIDNLIANQWSTILYPALKLASEQFSSYARIRKIILVATDGHTNGAAQCLTYGEFLKASGIEIMTIGTEDADKEFLEKLSSGNKTLRVTDGELRKGLKGMAGYLNA